MHENAEPDCAPSPPQRKRRRLVLVLFLLTAAAGLVVMVSISVQQPRSEVVWLSPSALARAKQPTLLSRVKARLGRLFNPVLSRWRSPKPLLDLNVDMALLSPGAERDLLGPTPGNSNRLAGTGWILLEPAASELGQRLKTNAGMLVLANFRGISMNGRQMQFSQIPGPNPLGFRMDALPTLKPKGIELLVAASAIQYTGTTNLMPVRTNFSTACKALVPDAGALVILSRSNSTNCLFLISPTPIDSRGNRVRR